MKTVHLISGGDAGGARTHVLRLLGELNKTGQAQLLCLGGGALADAFRNVKNTSKITRSYRKKTFSLRCKLFLKIWKRWFMYTPWVRSLIMRSGIESIRVRRSKED